MSNISSKALASFKYVYLAIFFALLSGFFHPLITNTSFDIVIIGSLVLSVGLAIILIRSKYNVRYMHPKSNLYKAATSDTKKEIFFASGFALIGISIYYIFEYAGKY